LAQSPRYDGQAFWADEVTHALPTDRLRKELPDLRSYLLGGNKKCIVLAPGRLQPPFEFPEILTRRA
jgi:hypothetical protein